MTYYMSAYKLRTLLNTFSLTNKNKKGKDNKQYHRHFWQNENRNIFCIIWREITTDSLIKKHGK